MRNCGGFCALCGNPCYRGEIRGNQEKLEEISSISPQDEEGASRAFDAPIVAMLQNEEEKVEETGLSVIENIGTYEVKKSVFGKEKVRKVK